MSTTQTPIQLQREIFTSARTIGRPIAQIMSWVFDPRNLRAAWQRVADADGAKTPGPDGRTVRDTLARRDRWLNQLAAKLYRGTFPPSPPRYVDVPKNGDPRATRRLGILNVEDRVVHAALKQVLEPILEPDFSPGSFGFRPGRSVPGALMAAVQGLSRGDFPYVCKLDVADCFDTIDHATLLARLREVIADEDALALLARLLDAGGRTTGWWQRRAVGLVQGSGLSPLLCNFYLDPLDKALEALAQRTRQGILPLRYADDLLVLARSPRCAREAVRLTRHTLGRLHQRLKATKSAVVPSRQGIRWLGVDIRPRQEAWLDRPEFTYWVPDEKVTAMLQRITEMTEPPNARIDPAAFDLGRWVHADLPLLASCQTAQSTSLSPWD